MSQSLEECKSRLASINSYRRQLVMVTKANMTSSKTIDFSFRAPLGFKGETVITPIESDGGDQFAFESWGGNIDLMGLVELDEVRPDCTEITVALHYEIKNKFYAWIDRKFGLIDRFLMTELRSLRSHFEGIAAPVSERPPMYAVLEPASA